MPFLALITMCCSYAQTGTLDPAKALAKIAEVRRATMKEPRPGFYEFDAEPPRRLAKEIVKGLDPAKLDDARGDLWSKLFTEAEDYSVALQLAKRFAGQVSDPTKRCAGYLTALNAAIKGKFATAVPDLVKACRPTSPAQMEAYSFAVCSQAECLILVKQGPERASEFLRAVERSAPWKGAGLDESASVSYEVDLSSLIAHLEGRAGRPNIGLEKLADALPRTKPGSREYNSLKRRETELRLLGKQIPPLKAEAAFGRSVDLHKLTGQVVLLDFYAHWCGPCIVTFPETKRLYAEDRSKGFEVLGITRDWGYFGQDKNIAPALERQKLAEFVNHYELPWTPRC